ncbi:MAG: VWA domain-containing protein [Lentisphaeria bacterium]|jgi:Ca-activated chloride channel family protein|nr:VWA domain-containing protein [Lentisphaeria bacterium]
MRFVLSQPWFLLLLLPLLLLLAFPSNSAALPCNLEQKPKAEPHFLHPAQLWRLLLLLAAACLLLALCQPTLIWQEKHQQTTSHELLFLLDVSGSMQAIDPDTKLVDPNSLPNEQLPPRRLQLAKQSIALLLADLADCKAGLLAFAGECYLVCPPVKYHNILLERMRSLQSEQLLDGTSIDAALQAALEILQNNESRKSIILISDGADHGERNPAKTAQELAENRITIHCLGIGGEEGLHQVNTDTGQRWQAIAESLDEARLQEIANIGGGIYRHLSRSKAILPVIGSLKQELSPQYRETKRNRQKPLLRHCIIAALLLSVLGARMHHRHTLLQTQ